MIIFNSKKKGEIKTQINDLKFELNRLDNVLEKIDTDKNLFLVSAIKLKHKNFSHYLNFQGSLDTDQMWLFILNCLVF